MAAERADLVEPEAGPLPEFGGLRDAGCLQTGLRRVEQEDGSFDPPWRCLICTSRGPAAGKADGRPERASLPGYMKRTSSASCNSIRREDAPALEQLGDTLAFIAELYKPISVQGFQTRRAARAGSARSRIFLGINVAPQPVTFTAVEEYLHDIAPPVHRTKGLSGAG